MDCAERGPRKRSRPRVPLAGRLAQRVAQREDLPLALIEPRLQLADAAFELERALRGAVGLLAQRPGQTGQLRLKLLAGVARQLALEHGELRVLALEVRVEVQ